MINHIFYPEAVLVSHVQYHRAKDLYKKVEKHDSFIYDIGIDAITKYLEAARKEIEG